jgi:hypothetical protein
MHTIDEDLRPRLNEFASGSHRARILLLTSPT